MPLTQLSILAIPGLVRKADEILNDILAQDVIKRLGVQGKRSLIITVDLEPKLEETPNGDQENIPKLGFKVGHRLPASQGLQGLRAFVDRNPKTGETCLAIKAGDPLGTDRNQMDLSDVKGAFETDLGD